MSSNVENRSRLKKGKAALKLSRRQASFERWSHMSSWKSFEIKPKSLPNPKISYIAYRIRERLQSSQCNGKIPSGLKIKDIVVKGQNSQVLKEKFDTIIKDTTIESLR